MHSEQRNSAWSEAAFGLITGAVYGATVTVSGHPLDTIKSKMQVQKGFTNLSSVQAAKTIWKAEGVRGFYRGCIPPLWGSAGYRGIQISGYEYAYTWLEMNLPSDSYIKKDIGLGLRPLVPLAAVFSAALRVCLESTTSLTCYC